MRISSLTHNCRLKPKYYLLRTQRIHLRETLARRSCVIEILLVIAFLILAFGVSALLTINPAETEEVIRQVDGSFASFTYSFCVTTDFSYKTRVSVSKIENQVAEVDGLLQVVMGSELVEERVLSARA